MLISNVVFAGATNQHHNANFGHLESADASPFRNTGTSEPANVLADSQQSNIVEGDSDIFGGLGLNSNNNSQKQAAAGIQAELEELKQMTEVAKVRNIIEESSDGHQSPTAQV